MKKVYSGVQPTGGMHIGNYLGAGRNYVDLQAEYECIYGIVDLHAMTTPFEPAELRADTMEAAKLMLAYGIDPERSVLYLQSQVPQHPELAWILGTLTPMGVLNRMTQFKEKSDKHGSNLGLFSYPVLQAADIILYRVHAVPIGEDQKQHLEMTRDVAERFNNRFGEVFPVPEAIIPEVGARVMSLLDPEAKMSKSDSSENSLVKLVDPPDVIRKKFSRAVTDSETEVRYDWDRKPGVSNLLEILALFSGTPIEDLERDLEGAGYAKLKEAAAEATVEALVPIQARYQDLSDAEVGRVLSDGRERATEQAEATMVEVRRVVGLSD